MPQETNQDDGNRTLEGWKLIAAYLHRAPRTVQVWERDHGLPVHRLQGRTYAETRDLDLWLVSHRSLAKGPTATQVEEEPPTAGLVAAGIPDPALSLPQNRLVPWPFIAATAGLPF